MKKFLDALKVIGVIALLLAFVSCAYFLEKTRFVFGDCA
jgi:hypothetical protein